MLTAHLISAEKLPDGENTFDHLLNGGVRQGVLGRGGDLAARGGALTARVASQAGAAEEMRAPAQTHGLHCCVLILKTK